MKGNNLQQRETEKQKDLIARTSALTLCNIAYEINYIVHILSKEGVSPNMLVESLKDEEKVKMAYLMGVHGKSLINYAKVLAKRTLTIPEQEKKGIIDEIDFDQSEYFKYNEPIFVRGIQGAIHDLLLLNESLSYSGEDASEDDTIDDLPFQ